MEPHDIRTFATGLPDVSEQPHFGHPAFRVRDKLFASLHPDEELPFAIVHVDRAAAAAALRGAAEGLEEVWRTHGGRDIFVGLRVELAKVSPEAGQLLLQQAWRNKAPKRLAAQYDGET